MFPLFSRKFHQATFQRSTDLSLLYFPLHANSNTVEVSFSSHIKCIDANPPKPQLVNYLRPTIPINEERNNSCVRYELNNYLHSVLNRNAPPVGVDDLDLRDSDFSFLVLLALQPESFIAPSNPCFFQYKTPTRTTFNHLLPLNGECLHPSAIEESFLLDLSTLNFSLFRPEMNSIDEICPLDSLLQKKLDFSFYCQTNLAPDKLHPFWVITVENDFIHHQSRFPALQNSVTENFDESQLTSVLLKLNSLEGNQKSYELEDNEDLCFVMLARTIYPEKNERHLNSWLEIIAIPIKTAPLIPRRSGNNFPGQFNISHSSSIIGKMIPQNDNAWLTYPRRSLFCWLNFIPLVKFDFVKHPIYTDYRYKMERLKYSVEVVHAPTERDFLLEALHETELNCSACFAFMNDSLSADVDNREVELPHQSTVQGSLNFQSLNGIKFLLAFS